MRLISSESQASDGSGSLTMTQLRALGLLKRGRRLPSELARDLGVTPATSSELVDLLVRRGMVERGDEPEDRRLTPLRVTSAGLTRLESSRARALAALDILLEGAEASELVALETGLKLLLNRIHEKTPSTGGGHAG
ncbi:MAG: MarR family winged helix-turn-helix transcriptional regulator [Chloroflexota bacterium]